MAEHALEICEHAYVAIGLSVNPIDKIRARKMQALFGDFWRFESQQGIGFCAEISFNFSSDCSGWHFFFLVFPRARRSGQLFSNAS